MKTCRYCGAQWEDGDTCPNCRMALQYSDMYGSGQSAAQQNSGTQSNTIWIVLAIVGGFLLLAAAGVCLVVMNAFMTLRTVNEEPHSPEISSVDEYIPSENIVVDPESERQENLEFQKKKGIFVAGDYQIGRDIPAGEYVAVANGNTPTQDFYLGVYTSASHSEESELMGGWCRGSKILVLEEGQYLELIHANLYDLSKHQNPLDPFQNSGMFKVGTDVEAGTYTVHNHDEQYTGFYTIYSSINCIAPITRDRGVLDAGASCEITVQDGEYLEMEICCLQP